MAERTSSAWRTVPAAVTVVSVTASAPTVICQECGHEVAADELRLEMTDEGELLVYCSECWEREFGET